MLLLIALKKYRSSITVTQFDSILDLIEPWHFVALHVLLDNTHRQRQWSIQRHTDVPFHTQLDSAAVAHAEPSVERCSNRCVPVTIRPLDGHRIVWFKCGGHPAVPGKIAAIRQAYISGRCGNGRNDPIAIPSAKGLGKGHSSLLNVHLQRGVLAGISHSCIGNPCLQIVPRVYYEFPGHAEGSVDARARQHRVSIKGQRIRTQTCTGKQFVDFRKWFVTEIGINSRILLCRRVLSNVLWEKEKTAESQYHYWYEKGENDDVVRNKTPRIWCDSSTSYCIVPRLYDILLVEDDSIDETIEKAVHYIVAVYSITLHCSVRTSTSQQPQTEGIAKSIGSKIPIDHLTLVGIHVTANGDRTGTIRKDAFRFSPKISLRGFSEACQGRVDSSLLCSRIIFVACKRRKE